MKHVLWISRHSMDKTQRDGLRNVAGDDVQITRLDIMANSAEKLANTAKSLNCDIIAAALPVRLLAGIKALCPEKTLCVPRSKRVLTKTREPGERSSTRFVYDGWEIVRECLYRADVVY